MKTHFQSSQTYSCGVCGKEFKRADHRKRHQEVHDQRRFFECPHCTSSFMRERDLRQHVSNRHRDVNGPTSTGPSGDKSRSPIRRSTERPSVRQPSVQDEPQILPEDPETRILYLRHWEFIRTGITLILTTSASTSLEKGPVVYSTNNQRHLPSTCRLVLC